MDLIYTDRNGIEKGALQNYSLDLECGGSNDFQIVVGSYNNVLKQTDRVHIEGTEYGGIVDSVKSDTGTKQIYYSGRTWRGILTKKIIKPLPGDDYYSVSGEVNQIIRQMINYLQLNEIFKADEVVSEFTIGTYYFNRYVSLLDGLNALLKNVGARLNIRYEDRMVVLSADPIVDYSEEIEYSSDGKVQFIAEDNQGGVNHLICLGQGDLALRQVIDLYVDEKGNVSETQTYFGLDEIVETYDYPNAETLEELRKSGIERLNELKNYQKMEVNVQDMQVELYDIIAGREEITGLYIKQPVNQKIVRVNNNILKTEYKVGD